MQYSYFSVISGFLYKTEDPFRNCSCSSPEISLLVLKTFQHSKRNFVSPRGHVISSIEACLFWIVAYGKRNITFEARLFCFMAYRTRNFYIWSALNDSKIGGYKVTGGKSLGGELLGYHAHTVSTPWEKTDYNSPGKEAVKHCKRNIGKSSSDYFHASIREAAPKLEWIELGHIHPRAFPSRPAHFLREKSWGRDWSKNPP